MDSDLHGKSYHDTSQAAFGQKGKSDEPMISMLYQPPFESAYGTVSIPTPEKQHFVVGKFVKRKDCVRALRAVHSRFYLSKTSIAVSIIGPGLIGATLLPAKGSASEHAKKFLLQAAELKEKSNTDLRVMGVIGSTTMLLSNTQNHHGKLIPFQYHAVENVLQIPPAVHGFHEFADITAEEVGTAEMTSYPNIESYLAVLCVYAGIILLKYMTSDSNIESYPDLITFERAEFGRIERHHFNQYRIFTVGVSYYMFLHGINSSQMYDSDPDIDRAAFGRIEKVTNFNVLVPQVSLGGVEFLIDTSRQCTSLWGPYGGAFYLVVVQFLLDHDLHKSDSVSVEIDEPNSIEAMSFDEEVIGEFKDKFMKDSKTKYVERLVKNSSEAIEEAIHEHSKCNLILVGRMPEGELVASLRKRSKCPEMGSVGNLLFSPEFNCLTLVFVVQQYHSQLSMHSLISLKEDEVTTKDKLGKLINHIKRG
ncbi:cation/H+ exchanger 19 [Artemisia annua]|uniref:Cation/H+ exchanger 19 n=1 Tax=Artemisia annua TaxID=35608 RepID=A0A2U1N8Z6_ARTAN|nr:cation/H+ exchanger 19 [Artemisia annua]